MKTAQDYINLAFTQAQDDQTFAAKSHQKEALGHLNRAYEVIRNANQTWQLSEETRATDDDFWAVPFDLHQIREKHFRLFNEAHHADLTDLVTFRVFLKELEMAALDTLKREEKVGRKRLRNWYRRGTV